MKERSCESCIKCYELNRNKGVTICKEWDCNSRGIARMNLTEKKIQTNCKKWKPLR